MKIVISGASGLIGTQLVTSLKSSGHEVVQLVRRSAAVGQIMWDPKSGKLDPASLEGCDAVIHLSGAGIGDKRWSDAYRKEILDSRTQTTALLATTIASLQRKPSVFLSGSAIGIYGARGDEQLTETSEHGTGFLADVSQWFLVFAIAGLGVSTSLKSMMELGGKSIALMVLQTVALLGIAILAVSTDFI